MRFVSVCEGNVQRSSAEETGKYMMECVARRGRCECLFQGTGF